MRLKNRPQRLKKRPKNTTGSWHSKNGLQGLNETLDSGPGASRVVAGSETAFASRRVFAPFRAGARNARNSEAREARFHAGSPLTIPAKQQIAASSSRPAPLRRTPTGSASGGGARTPGQQPTRSLGLPRSRRPAAGTTNAPKTHGGGRLADRVGLVDDWGDLAGFDQGREALEVGIVVFGVFMVSR